MHIKILGSGCKKCLALAKNFEVAAKAAGIEFEIEKVKDIVDISRFCVMSTPGLVIDDVVISAGKVLSVAQISEHLRIITSKSVTNRSNDTNPSIT